MTSTPLPHGGPLDTPCPRGTALDALLPRYEFRDARAIVVRADPERIFRALRAFTLDDIPLARLLGFVRYLPARLTGAVTDPIHDTRPFLDIVLQTNILLWEDPGCEVIIGVIGKFHQVTNQEPVSLAGARGFLLFDDPAYQKLAQSFRIAGGNADDGYTLIFEHRTHALSEASRRRFARYWIVIKPASAWIVAMMLRAIKRRAEAAG